MDTLTQDTLPDGGNIAPAGGGVSVENANAKGLHEIVSDLTGKTFPTPESAAKAIVDTFNATGKWGKFAPLIGKLEAAKGGEENVLKFMETIIQPQPVVPETVVQPAVDTSKFVSSEQYQEDMWFASHSDVAPYKALIKGLKLQNPTKSFDELLAAPEFKPLLDAKANSATDSSRSVIHSNADVQQVSTDYAEDFAKAKASGNWVDFLGKHKGIKLD